MGRRREPGPGQEPLGRRLSTGLVLQSAEQGLKAAPVLAAELELDLL